MGEGGFRRLLRLFTGRDAREELDEELETHVALRAQELERAGLDPERARTEARRRLGERSRLYASARARDTRLRRREWLASLRSDLVLALRRARRLPAATAVTLATYALGIGLTTAGFAVVDGVLVRGLPYPAADRLVALLSVSEDRTEFGYVSATAWRDWRAGAPAAARSALHGDHAFTVSTGDAAWRVPGQRVSGAFFDVIGTPMLRGRAFTADEIENEERLAVVSESFWRTWLGAPPALPDALLLDGTAYTVVGVVPHGGGYPAGAQVWVGIHPTVLTHDGAYNLINWGVVARLPDGVTPAAARAELDPVARRIREAHPGALYSWGVGVQPLRERVVGGVRRSLAVLAGAVLLVLLIACVNVAGLGLAQGATRTDEIRVRTSLGASRGRLIRQLLTEQVAMAIAGALLGIALAVCATRLVGTRAAAFLPRAGEITLDVRALAFAAAVTLTAGVLSGLIPALRVSGTRLSGAAAARGGVRGGRRLPAAFLVGAELALALVLLHGTALLTRSFASLLSRDLGFDSENVVTAQVPLTSAAYMDEAARVRFWSALRERVERVPGVQQVALANAVPGDGGGNGFIDVAGYAGDAIGAGYRVVSHGYLELLDMPLLRGRSFDVTDREGSQRVVVINRAMADRYWPGGDALGGQVKATSMEGHIGAEWLTVIGVVGDIRHYGYEIAPAPEMYVLDRQVPAWTYALFVVARGAEGSDASGLLGGIASAIRAEDRTLAADYATLEARVHGNIAERRFVTLLLGLFAALSVLLSAVGLYGLLSFAVARQSREMGVRAALGARRGGLVRLVLGRALRILVAGAVLGLLAAVALSRVLRSLLVDIAPDDAVATLAALLILLATGLVAALVPAWRAARADPLEALRAQ